MEVLVMERNNVEAMVVRGRVFERQEDIQSAQKCYEQAIRTPNCVHTGAFFHLGVVYEKNKNIKEAHKMLKQCLLLD